MLIRSHVRLTRFLARSLMAAALLFAALAVTTAPARADLRVCNQSSNTVSIALGYRADRGWQSEGWWVAPSGDCAIVVQGELNSRFYYLYIADDIGGGAWDGDNFMCTRDESFTIFDTGDCLARGYERTGFFEVDTQNKSDWTLQLKDPVNNDTTGSDTGDDAPLGDEGDVPIDDVPAE
jgi:uncharacterized membrane protein